MCIEKVFSELNRLNIYPKHGWVQTVADSNEVFVVMPFIGYMRCKHEQLLQSKDPKFHLFATAKKDFQERVILYLKSLELWYEACTTKEFKPFIMLYSDLALYEFGCLADSLARLLPFQISDRPDQVKSRSFGALRKWVLTNASNTPIGKAIANYTKWYDEWDGSAAGKGARDQRTHHYWSYRSCFHTTQNWTTVRLIGPSSNGKTGKCDVIALLGNVTKGLFEFLEKITPPECNQYDYCLDELQTLSLGRWLSELVPCLGL